MALEGLKGLSSQDRADWEKKYSSQIQGWAPENIDRLYKNMKFKERFGNREDYSSLKALSPEERDTFYNNDVDETYRRNLDSIARLENTSFNQGSDIVKPKVFGSEEYSRLDEFKNASEAYQIALQEQQGNYANNPKVAAYDSFLLREKANEISPYYQKYKDTSYLPISEDEWQSLSTEYNARKEAFGEQQADYWLQGAMQDTVSENQSLLEKTSRAFSGILTTGAGAIISTIGMLKGAHDYAFGYSQDVEGLSDWNNFWNSVIDNNFTRYGNDVAKYGTFNPNAQEEAEQLGLALNEIVQTQAQQDGTASLGEQIFNINTIPIALQSGGYTVASMYTGAGYAGLSKMAFGSLKSMATVNKIASSSRALRNSNLVLRALDEAENAVDKFIIPGLVGTTEGVVEGLNTKLDVFENGKAEADKAQAEYVDKRFQQIISENPGLTIDEAYNQAFKEYEPKYEEALQQVEFAASKAGINNFFLNSAINGFINQTLKAGLQSPRVENALKNSKMFGWVHSRPKFSVDDAYNVTPKFGLGKQAWNIVKEPLGEFSEEYLQSLSDAFAKGGAEHNIHSFIENKYSGDGLAEVGDYMAGDLAAAFAALGEEALSNVSIKAGIYGAISSSLGTPAIRARDYVTVRRNSKGELVKGYGLSRREGESRLEHLSRIMPWRSGLSNAVRENVQAKRRAYDEAQSLEDWLKDSNNRAKFDGLGGTLNWAKEMENSAKYSDEFGYRNSTLGKTINDAFMLSKLRGTKYYDAYMKEVNEIANLEEGTELANKYVKAMRENIHTNDDSMTDFQILEQLKENANKLISTIDDINTESQKINKTLGNVDEDTKQSLVYGILSLKDWSDRTNKLSEELSSIKIDNTTKGSNMDTKVSRIIAKYGSLDKALKEKESIQRKIDEVYKDISNLKKLKSRTTEQDKILKEKNVRLKTLKKDREYLRNIDNIEVEDTILNEQEIMSLPILERASMLSKKNLNKYSEAQQDVINNLINKGTAQDIGFYEKIQDIAKIEIANETFINQYNAILKDPNSYNAYVQAAKAQAKDNLTKKRFDVISQITNYKDFALELDKVIESSTNREKALIFRNLEKSDNTNYTKYKQSRQMIESLYSQMFRDKAFSNMEDNEVELFAHTLSYLANNDIDYNDSGAVTTALAATDEHGNNLFEQYVSNINEHLPEEDRPYFTSVGEVIQTFNNIMSSYLKDTQETVRNSKEVIPESTPPIESKPVSEEQVRATVVAETPEPVSGIPAPSVTQSDESVSSAITIGQNLVRNTSPLLYSEDARREAVSFYDELSKESFSSIEEFTDRLYTLADSDTIKSNPNAEEISGILKNIAFRVSSSSTVKPVVKEATPRIAPDKANSSTLQTMSITFGKKEYPDSPTSKYFTEHKVEEYLLSKDLKKNNPNVPVHYITDEVLTKEVMDSMGSTFTEDSIPIIAVVKDDAGDIIIPDENGNDVKYQAIGILSASNNDKALGTNNSRKIRELSKEVESGKLIKDSNGNILTSTISVIKANIDRIPIGEPNKDIQSLALGEMSKGDALMLSTATGKEKRALPLYQVMKNKVLDMIKVGKSISPSGKERKYFYIEQPNLKREVPKDTEVFITSISKSIHRDTGESLKDLLQDSAGNAVTIASFNSRISRFFNVLDKLTSNLPSEEDITLTEDSQGRDIPTGEYAETLKSIAEDFTRKSNNYLSLPNQSWKYELVPTGRDLNGEYTYGLNLTNGKESIRLLIIGKSSLSIEGKAAILKHMLLDNEGNYRLNPINNRYELFKWQVEYPSGESNVESVRQSLDSAFDDNILDMSMNSLHYKVSGPELRSPFTSKGETIIYTPPTVANSDNATSFNSAPIGEVQQNGVIIDTDSGIVTQGIAEPANVKQTTNARPTPSNVSTEDVEIKRTTYSYSRRPRKGAKNIQRASNEIIQNVEWDSFGDFVNDEGKRINFEESRQTISSIYTKEQWDEMTYEERCHELKCKGSF